MVTTLKNDYYLCWPDRHEAWTPEIERPHPHWVRTRYFSRVFHHMEAQLERGDLTIYLTSDVHKLPSYGDNVVAVLQEDEPARVPHYFDRVLATFTCYGTHQPLRPNPLVYPAYENFISAGRYLYSLLRRSPGLLRRKILQYVRSENLSPIYTIPLGYANQVDLAIQPILDRTTDVFFAGSVSHRKNDTNILRRAIGTAKYISRRKLVDVLHRLDENEPDLTIGLETCPSFSVSMQDSAEAYSRRMMDAKICPVPRGTSLESFRFFEAIRYGCIPIVEALPSRPYYDGSPALTIKSWTDLHRIVPVLLQDDTILAQKQRSILDWWQTNCSEKVVGYDMAQKLNALTRR
jgi:hypothetical protein